MPLADERYAIAPGVRLEIVDWTVELPAKVNEVVTVKTTPETRVKAMFAVVLDTLFAMTFALNRI